jgi:hypothetical protein
VLENFSYLPPLFPGMNQNKFFETYILIYSKALPVKEKRLEAMEQFHNPHVSG